MKLYAIDYDFIYASQPKEHRYETFSSDERQRWISRFFELTTCYYIENLKSYAIANMPEITLDEMNKIKEGI